MAKKMSLSKQQMLAEDEMKVTKIRVSKEDIKQARKEKKKMQSVSFFSSGNDSEEDS